MAKVWVDRPNTLPTARIGILHYLGMSFTEKQSRTASIARGTEANCDEWTILSFGRLEA
jgi:hypothetical protein